MGNDTPYHVLIGIRPAGLCYGKLKTRISCPQVASHITSHLVCPLHSLSVLHEIVVLKRIRFEADMGPMI